MVFQPAPPSHIIACTHTLLRTFSILLVCSVRFDTALIAIVCIINTCTCTIIPSSRQWGWERHEVISPHNVSQRIELLLGKWRWWHRRLAVGLAKMLLSHAAKRKTRARMSAYEGNWHAFAFEQQLEGAASFWTKKKASKIKRNIFLAGNTVDGEHDRLKICLRERELVCWTADWGLGA